MTPGTRSKSDDPMFEPEVFRKQMFCIEENTCDIVWDFSAPPAVVQDPHSDSLPGELCLPWPPSFRPCSPKKYKFANERKLRWGSRCGGGGRSNCENGSFFKQRSNSCHPHEVFRTTRVAPRSSWASNQGPLSDRYICFHKSLKKIEKSFETFSNASPECLKF